MLVTKKTKNNNRLILLLQVSHRVDLRFYFNSSSDDLDPLDKSATQKYVTYDELRQRNRTDHAAKFSGTKVRTGSSFALFPASFNRFTPLLLDAPAASGTALPAPIQDARSMPPLPIVSTEPPSPSKRSNKRKNQYGDEVYE